jgi:hypothetical protein
MTTRVFVVSSRDYLHVATREYFPFSVFALLARSMRSPPDVDRQSGCRSSSPSIDVA